MVYAVKLYYSTGFGNGNVPDSPAILETATKRDFDGVWLLQDRDVTQVKIKADWNEVKDADYAKIGGSYYEVTGINQLNGVAMLNLALDPLTTAGGIEAISVLDGWVNRASHKTNGFMQNTLPVEVKPTQPLVIDGPVALTDDTSDVYSFVGSTVNLIGATTTAAAITYSDANGKVTVPDIPEPTVETVFRLFAASDNPPVSWGNRKTQTAPNLTLFDLNGQTPGNQNTATNAGIKALRRLNLTDVITTSYSIPKWYSFVSYRSFGDPDPDADINWSQIAQVDSRLYLRNPAALPYRYGSYIPKNNRVYACQNQYTILSLASGEEKTFEAEELFSGGTEPDFYIYCDPSPEGKPYCQPSWYNGRNTMLFENAISGSPWLTTPVTLKGRSGAAFDEIAYSRMMEDTLIALNRRDTTNTLGLASTLLGAYGAAGGTPGGYSYAAGPKGDTLAYSQGTSPSALTLAGAAIGAVRNIYNAGYDVADIRRSAGRNQFDAFAQLKIVAPTIKFGRSTEMQGYVGNGFMVYRTRLSDIDMERLDNEFTYYGEPDNRRLEDNDLNSHQHFNYVDASNVTVIASANHTIPLEMRNRIGNMFNGGIRIWHELPNRAAMTDNPLKGV